MTCLIFIFPEMKVKGILNSDKSYEQYNLLNNLYNDFVIL